MALQSGGIAQLHSTSQCSPNVHVFLCRAPSWSMLTQGSYLNRTLISWIQRLRVKAESWELLERYIEMMMKLGHWKGERDCGNPAVSMATVLLTQLPLPWWWSSWYWWKHVILNVTLIVYVTRETLNFCFFKDCGSVCNSLQWNNLWCKLSQSKLFLFVCFWLRNAWPECICT